MRIKKIKLTAILLIIVMTASILIACGDADAPSAPNTPESNAGANNAGTETANGDEAIDPDTLGFRVSNLRENIPESDFGGRDFTILIADPDSQTWTYTNMVVEEQTGDSIDDVYYTRNLIIEELLNINIKQVMTPWDGGQTRFQRAVNAGDNAFDIAMMRYNSAANLAISNFLMALNDVPYLDFDKPWWDHGSLRDLSISSRNYLMASDIAIGVHDNTWLYYFDKQHVQDHGITSPYVLVNEGKWTFDAMFDMMRTVAADLDSDGRMTKDDRFGLLTHGENYAGMWIAAGHTLIAKDNNNDLPYIAFGNEGFISAWQKIVEIMNDDSSKTDDIEFISNGLRDGKTLFATEILKFVRDYRENEREFGILPVPKFSESQANYHTYVALSAPLLVIPTSNNDLTTTGIIIEAMTAEGHRTIMPEYYERSIKGKFVRDVESIEMLDIAFSTRMYDLGVVFNWGNMSSQLTTLGNRNSIDVMSMIEERMGVMQTAIDNALEVFEAD